MNTRRSLGIGLAVSSIFAITAAMQYAGRNAGHLGVALAQSTPESATIKSPWSIPLGEYLKSTSPTFSPDNAYFTVAGNPKGTVSLWRVLGKYIQIGDKTEPKPMLLWSQRVNGVTDAVVAPGGKAVIAFASQDPT